MEEETRIPAPRRQKMTAFSYCLGLVPGGLTEEFIMIVFTGTIVVHFPSGIIATEERAPATCLLDFRPV
ncbi:hypothetical protein M405DRAFT_804352 [Rhizopogon salebrosus TDB-379]|nr:hypothetical protein M405DRAFT_804352 [Rhizopogon salebrosus TDB-379]